MSRSWKKHLIAIAAILVALLVSYIGYCSKQILYDSNVCFVSLLKLDVSLCPVVHTTKYDELSSTCWKFVQNEASELSEKLHFTNDMNDMLFSNDFIDESRSMEIHERLSEAKWTNLDSYKLLMAVLPKSDNATYMRFCCLLRVKSNLPVMGKILCDECKPFQKCTMNQNVKFSIVHLARQF